MNRANPFELVSQPLPNTRTETAPVAEVSPEELRKEMGSVRAAVREREQEIQKKFALGPLLMSMEEQLRLVQQIAEDPKLKDLDNKMQEITSQIRRIERRQAKLQKTTKPIVSLAVPAESKAVETKPQRRSSVTRVVGKDISEQDREEILDSMAERYEDQSFGIKHYERPATEEEVHFMRWANEASNRMLLQYGIEPFDVPPRNIHVMRSDTDWGRGARAKGSFDPMFQGTAVRETPRPAEFVNILLHELIHLKSYGALMIKEPDQTVVPYRVGLTVTKRNELANYFSPLNEAVTEELAKRIFLNADEPKLRHIVQDTREFVAAHPDAVKDDGSPLFNEDTYDVEIVERSRNGLRLETNCFAYAKERHALWQLVDKLYSHNTDVFPDREAVFVVFARASLTGNLLPLGRLIERTFGPSTFRKIAECDDSTKFKNLVDSLPAFPGVNGAVSQGQAA